MRFFLLPERMHGKSRISYIDYHHPQHSKTICLYYGFDGQKLLMLSIADGIGRLARLVVETSVFGNVRSWKNTPNLFDHKWVLAVGGLRIDRAEAEILEFARAGRGDLLVELLDKAISEFTEPEIEVCHGTVDEFKEIGKSIAQVLQFPFEIYGLQTRNGSSIRVSSRKTEQHISGEPKARRDAILVVAEHLYRYFEPIHNDKYVKGGETILEPAIINFHSHPEADSSHDIMVGAEHIRRFYEHAVSSGILTERDRLAGLHALNLSQEGVSHDGME